MKKSELLKLVEDMADEIDMEELIYRLSVRKKIEHALDDIAAGRVIPHEQIAREIQGWLR